MSLDQSPRKGDGDDLDIRFWESLEKLSDHIPEYMKILRDSLRVDLGDGIIGRYGEDIENIMGTEFFERLTPEANVYDTINAITLKAQEFEDIRRLEAETLAGKLLDVRTKPETEN